MSVASDADVSVSSARSIKSAVKTGWSGLQIFHTQSKIKISEGAHGDGVILLDNVSTTSICKYKSMVNSTRNLIYKMELTTNDGTRIIEEESNITGFGKVMFSKDAVANIFSLVDLMNV